MKYINIKRYKFSTILKNTNSLIVKIVKSINTLIVKNFKILNNNVLKIFKFINLQKYDFKKFYKYLDIRRLYFTKIIKYFDPRTYNIARPSKIQFLSSKFLLFHFPASIVFFWIIIFSYTHIL